MSLAQTVDVAELPVGTVPVSPDAGCAVMLTEEYQSEEKQNLNVILVPESVLLALRNSACDASAAALSDNNNFCYLKCMDSTPVMSSLDSASFSVDGCSGTTTSNNDLTVVTTVGADNPSAIHPSQFLTVDSNDCATGSVPNPGGSLDRCEIVPDGNKMVQLPQEKKFVSNPNDLITIIPKDVVSSGVGGVLTTVQAPALDSVVNIRPHGFKGVKTIVMSVGPNTDIQIRPAKHSALSPPGSAQPLLTYKCMVFNCKKSFNSFEELEKHRNKHQNLKIYQCPHPDCPWSFKTPYKLRRHMQSHNQSKQYKCQHSGCDIVCSTSYNLKAHEKIHRDGSYLKCEECSMTFTNKHRQRKHLRQVHHVAPKFECCFKGCDKKLTSRSTLVTHVNSHTNPKMEFVCTFENCGKKFKKFCRYKEHIMSRHTDIRPFKCDFPDCTWAFTSMAKLKRHEVIHTEKTRFSCPIESCKSTFHRLEHVRSHLRVHSARSKDSKTGTDGPELPIESNEDNLVYYLCPYEECGSLFVTLVGAKQHIQKIHGSASKQSSESSDAPTNDVTPVSITLEAVLKSDSEADAPAPCGGDKISVIVTGDSSEDDKELKNGLPATTGQDLPNLLTTIIETEPSTSQPRDILTETNQQASQPCFSALRQSLGFSTVQGGEQSYSSMPSTELGSMQDYALSSPLQSRLDTSQYLLDPATDFVTCSSAVSPSLPSRETIDFMTMSPHSTYTTTTSADRFLNFGDCVPTVDPNVVMSVPSSCRADPVHPASASSSLTFQSPNKNPNDGNSKVTFGGSARTDCNAYRRACIGKRTHSSSKNSFFMSPKRKPNDHPAFENIVTSPTKSFEAMAASPTKGFESLAVSPTKSTSVCENMGFVGDVSSFMLNSPPTKQSISDPCDLHLKMSHFLHDPGSSRQLSDDRFKPGDVMNLQEQDFTGSTINLSDLA